MAKNEVELLKNPVNAWAIYTSELDKNRSECERSNANWDRSKRVWTSQSELKYPKLENSMNSPKVDDTLLIWHQGKKSQLRRASWNRTELA